MSERREWVRIRLTERDRELALQLAKEHCERLMADGDRLTAMPWTSAHWTEDEPRAWLASRPATAQTIDPATCELEWWHICHADPYRIMAALDEIPPGEEAAEQYAQIGRGYFVRGPQSRGWVHEWDLSDAQLKAVRERRWVAQRN
jgi:hypothetical protein